MFYGHYKGQAAYDAEVHARLRDYEQRQHQLRKDEVHQQRLAYVRSGLVGALASAPPGLFGDTFALERAAEAALAAGLRQS